MRKVLESFLLGVFSFCAIFQISCDNSDNLNSNCENVFCTLELRTIVVSIEDSDQAPVALDSFEVIDTVDGSDLTISLSPFELEIAQQSGKYPLISDLEVKANQELDIQFKGFINDTEVIVSGYTIAADCCHIGLVSGNLQLVL